MKDPKSALQFKIQELFIVRLELTRYSTPPKEALLLKKKQFDKEISEFIREKLPPSLEETTVEKLLLPICKILFERDESIAASSPDSMFRHIILSNMSVLFLKMEKRVPDVTDEMSEKLQLEIEMLFPVKIRNKLALNKVIL